MRYVIGVSCVAGAALAVMAWLSVPKPSSATASAGEPSLSETKQQSTTATVAIASRPETTDGVALVTPAAASAETATAPELAAQRAALARLGGNYPRLRATTSDDTPIVQSVTAVAPPGQTAIVP